MTQECINIYIFTVILGKYAKNILGIGQIPVLTLRIKDNMFLLKILTGHKHGEDLIFLELLSLGLGLVCM